MQEAGFSLADTKVKFVLVYIGCQGAWSWEVLRGRTYLIVGRIMDQDHAHCWTQVTVEAR